jgi:hypothetical protein
MLSPSSPANLDSQAPQNYRCAGDVSFAVHPRSAEIVVEGPVELSSRAGPSLHCPDETKQD